MKCDELKKNSGSREDYIVDVLYANINGLHANISNLALTGQKFDVLICAESLVSNWRHLSKFCNSNFSGR